MLVRNLLQAGDFVEPLPFGLPVTLSYNPNGGQLENIYIGYEIKDENKSKVIFSSVIKQSKAPTHVSTNGGTLYIRGILYTGAHYSELGIIPNARIPEMIQSIEDGCEYNIFAGHVHSTAMTFIGNAQVRTWLQGQGFNVLPGMIVPTENIDTSLQRFIETTSFKYEEIFGYFIFRGDSFEIKSCENYVDKIKKIEIYLDSSGCVRSNIFLTWNEEDSPIYTSYYDVITKQLYSGDEVLVSKNNAVISKLPKPKKLAASGEYSCPFCGRKYTIDSEFSMCPDTHCLSRLYNPISHFLNKLNLVKLSYEQYLEYVNSGQIKKISDVWNLPEYRDLTVEVSISDLLDAIIPVGDVRNRSSIWELYSKCNGSWESIYYYINHPNLIQSDLKINSPELISWFEDKENVTDVEEIIQYTNVLITNYSKKFEGSPIFKDKNIVLTGKFSHGSLAEVSSILQSYSANISTWDEADCCIIGDIPEDIEGAKINSLKTKGVPVFTESEFFARYDIDSDLS